MTIVGVNSSQPPIQRNSEICKKLSQGEIWSNDISNFTNVKNRQLSIGKGKTKIKGNWKIWQEKVQILGELKNYYIRATMDFGLGLATYTKNSKIKKIAFHLKIIFHYLNL